MLVGEPRPTVTRPPYFAPLESSLRTLYQLALADHAGAVTVLHLGAEDSTVLARSGREPAGAWRLALGTRKTAREFFRAALPSALEMETAIAAVEDEVLRLADLPAGSRLVTGDTAMRRIAALAGVPRGERMVLSLDAMEALFQRLAAVIEGRPAAHENLPASAGFAAALLILREFMHHQRFATITVLVAAGDDDQSASGGAGWGDSPEPAPSAPIR